MVNGNALVKLDRALPITSMADLSAMGQLLAQSGMFGINNPAAGFVLAATCHSEGISPLEFKRTYHIIDGTPSMRADAMLAGYRTRGGKYKIIEISNIRAAADFEFEKQKIQFEFTMDEAKRSGICFKGDGKTLKANWSRSPKNMLWARMASNAVRFLCPEIVAGSYTPEEIEDMRTEPDGETSEPVAIENISDRVNAMKTANPIQDEPQPTQPTNSEPNPWTAKPIEQKPAFDYSICPDMPGCKVAGMKWSDMDLNTLGLAIQLKHPMMEPEHYAAIRDAANAKAAKP